MAAVGVRVRRHSSAAPGDATALFAALAGAESAVTSEADACLPAP
jgi:hypothetical protein